MLVFCADINTITTKKMSRYASYADSCQEKRVCRKSKADPSEGKTCLYRFFSKLTEENKRLNTFFTELERTTVLLTQPVPRHSSKHVLEENNLKKHTTLRSKLKRKKRNERSSRQYF